MSDWYVTVTSPTSSATVYGTLRPVSMSMSWRLNNIGSLDIECLRDPNNRNLLWDKDLDQVGGGGVFPPAGGFRLSSTTFCAAVWVYYKAQAVWAGLIWDVSGSSDSETVRVHCEEFPSFFAKVLLDSNFSIASQATSSIISQLVTLYNPIGLITSFTVYDGSSTFGTMAPRWYSYEYRTIAACIDEVVSTRTAAGQALIDWRQQVGQDPLSTGWYVEWEFSAGRMGYLREWPGVDWGQRSRKTVDNYRFSWSMKQAATRVKVPAFGERSQQIVGSAGAGLGGFDLGIYTPTGPRLDHVESRPDIRSQQAANNEAARILLRRGFPYQIQVSAIRRPESYFDPWLLGTNSISKNTANQTIGPRPGDSVPVFIDDGDVGPTVTDTWPGEAVSLAPKWMRITEMTLSVTQAKEEVSLNLSYDPT